MVFKYPQLIKKKIQSGLVGAIACIAVTHTSYAQNSYPNRPISIVVPFTPGGTTDLITRIIAQGLSKELGQPIVVENRGGASGMIGTDYVLRTKPDGYTLGMGGSTSLTVAPYLRANKPYDSRSDITPIAMVAGGPFIFAISPKNNVQTVQNFIEQAKKKPGTLNFGSSGIGSMHHVLAVKFNQLANIDAVHVPFKGGLESATNLVGGNIDYLFESVSSILPMIQDGRVKALAVTSPQRLDALPAVPTVAEATGTDYTGVSFIGIIGPKGLPHEVVRRLSEAVATTLEDPDIRTRIETLGSTPDFIPSQRFDEIIKRDVEAWSTVIREAQIQEM